MVIDCELERRIGGNRIFTKNRPSKVRVTNREATSLAGFAETDRSQSPEGREKLIIHVAAVATTQATLGIGETARPDPYADLLQSIRAAASPTVSAGYRALADRTVPSQTAEDIAGWANNLAEATHKADD